MTNKIDIIVEKLIELFDIYERYIWSHPDDDLKIIISYSCNKISIGLNKETEFENLVLSFTDKEKGLHNYICTSYLSKIFSNINIHNDEQNQTFFNQNHKPYLKVVVEDLSLLEDLKQIVEFQNSYQTENINILLKQGYKKLKRRERKINKISLEVLEDRVELTKLLLRRDFYA